MSDLIHYQKNMVCLTATEFDRLLNRLDKAENDLSSTQNELAAANHRVTLLEDQLRITEVELANMTKGFADEKECRKEAQ